MLNREAYIFEYEQVLMGKAKRFTAIYEGSEKERITAASYIWKYAVERLLHWTAEEAVLYMTDEVVYLLKLNGTFKAFGVVNRDKSYHDDYRFILRYAFPELGYSEDKEALDVYEHFAKLGRHKNANVKTAVKKSFFDGSKGSNHACLAFRHVKNMFLSDMTKEELYDFFNDEKRARRWLEKYELTIPLSTLFLTPRDYLHEALPTSEKDYFLYYAGIINEEWEKEKKREASK